MAYLNFQNCTRQQYEDTLYSQDAKNKIKILFNNTELEDADLYCERFTVKSRIIPNGAKVFSLNAFVSKEAELILHDIDTSIIQEQISISIGTLVNNSYEYVPIGIFNIQDTPTTDKNKTTIKLRDNSVKFDFNYNAKPLIDTHGGSATKLQILQDICSEANVTCNITSFIGSTDLVGIYDNTITARQYIADIAEQAGRIATINRNGELIFVNINSLTNWNIPLSIVEKYEIGKSYKIGKVAYEDGVVRYETPNTNYDTLFLDASNPYVSSQSQVNSILQQVNQFNIDSANTGAILGNPAIDGYDLINIYNNSVNGNPTVLKTLATSTLTYKGTLINQFDTQISEEEREQNVTISGEPTFKKWATTNINNIKGDITIQAGKIDTLEKETNPTGTSSGSTLYLENSGNAELLDFELEGKTTQANTPSPDNPQELVSVGYQNLNYTPYTNGISKVTNGITFIVNDDGEIIANGTATATAYFYCHVHDIAPFWNLPKGIYTISGCPVGGGDSTYQIGFRLYNNMTQVVGVVDKGSSITIDTTSYTYNRIMLYIEIFNGQQCNNLTFKPLVTKGGLIHSYIPYNKYGIEVKTTGKNLFDKNAITNGYRLNTTGIANVATSNGYTSDFISVESNTTYIRSFGGIDAYIRTCFYDSNKTFISKDDSNQIITTPSNAKYLRFSEYNSRIDTMQLEKGNQTTDYKSNQSNTYLYTLDNPLRSIGDIKDLLYIKNGMLYVDRKIGKVVLNGSEDWQSATSSYPNTSRFNYLNNDVINTHNSSDTKIYVKSDKFEATSFPVIYGSTGSANMISNYSNENITSGRIYIRIDNSLANSVSTFKTWLSTHNTEVNYILQTPYTEELGNVDVPSTYKGITYINTTDELQPNMNITYVKDTVITDYVEEHIAQIKINEDNILAEVQKKVDDNEIIAKLNLAIEDEQGIIEIVGNQVIIDSDYFKLNADGKITSTGGTIGGYKIGSNMLYAETYAPYDFTETDLNKIRDYLMDVGTLTPEEMQKYDLNGDGRITSADFLIMKFYLLYHVSTHTSAKIIMQTGNNVIDNAYILQDGLGNNVLNIGFNGILYNNFNITNSNVYSTEEQVIGIFKDGNTERNLYRKMIYISSFPNATEQGYATNIVNLDFAINIYGSVQTSTGSNFVINNVRPEDASRGIGAWIDNGNIKISTGANRSSYHGYVIIEYVKTID